MHGHANNWRTKRKNLVVVKFVILSFIFFAFFSPLFFLFNDNCLRYCSKLSNKWHLVRLCVCVFNKAKSALKQTKLCRLRGFLPLNCRYNFPAKAVLFSACKTNFARKSCLLLIGQTVLPATFFSWTASFDKQQQSHLQQCIDNSSKSSGREHSFCWCFCCCWWWWWQND